MFCLFQIPGSPSWNHKVQGFILIAWLGLWFQQTSRADAITAAVGQTVNINAQFSGTINSYTWYRGTVTLGDQIILTYIGASGLQRPGPQHTDRETGLSDGSLRIRDVLTNCTGNYTVIILTQDGISVTDTKQLRVHADIRSELITATVGQTVTFLAPVTERISSYTWYRGTAAVGDQAIFTYFGPSGPQTPGPHYTGRETGLPDGSLQIRDVLTNYSGNYTRSLLVVGGSPVALTKQLRVYVTGPPLCNRCSCWEVTLGATIGVFLCSTAVIAGVVFYYKRLLNQKEMRKDDFTYHNQNINQKPETQYENVTKGHKMHLANQPTVSDSPYMDLQHGDRATYEQIKR